VSVFQTLPPALLTPLPGPRSHALARRLAACESRNVTALEPGPIFWERAQGANVWDADGNRFIDLTAGFGVASVGHAHPRVVAAVAGQAERLLHGLGDVHPSSAKVKAAGGVGAALSGRRCRPRHARLFGIRRRSRRR
jgi:4-aminobutyrate aminotransferase-like enzyme